MATFGEQLGHEVKHYYEMLKTEVRAAIMRHLLDPEVRDRLLELARRGETNYTVPSNIYPIGWRKVDADAFYTEGMFVKQTVSGYVVAW